MPGKGWFFGLAIGLAALSQFGVQSPAQRPGEPVAAVSAGIAPPPQATPNPAPAVTLTRPSIGSDNLLSVAEIRYCLAEDIRITASQSVLDTTSATQIDRFNDFVDDYNRRCGSYRYPVAAMTKAQADVAPMRARLQTEGWERL